MTLYLGLDCSTQSLTAIVIGVEGSGPASIVCERSVEYDRDLPQYGTTHGVLESDDPRVVHSAPVMWAEALDVVFGRLRDAGVDFSGVRAIAGSAQQHGTVYLRREFADRLRDLDPAQPLARQLDGIFSRETSPVWLDSSTTEECGEITAAAGGAQKLARLTGSRAFARFAGPQIRRFFKTAPDRYAATARIDLVSSFLASLLAGEGAPLDPGDASGMNLMALETSAWLPGVLDATAPALADRLPPIVAADAIVGPVSAYWQRRYGLGPARIVVWTGDNPSSLIGTGLIEPGRLAISLGTSDTVFGPMSEPRVDAGLTGHVFGAPTSQFMGLTCFANGSLARERVRDAFELDWSGFSRALTSTPPGNGGALMLPWFVPEITPHVASPRVHRRGVDDTDPDANVRAIVEAQMMAMANHSQWMGEHVRVIHATGGASTNRELLQVMADVFGADVYRFQVDNAACLGAALRAWHADARAEGAPLGWRDIVRRIAEPIQDTRVAPRAAAAAVYADLRVEYARFEQDVLTAANAGSSVGGER